MTTDTKDTDKKRIAQTIAYYLQQGETPYSAREMAMDQLDWEESQREENRWRGSNDSEPLHSY